MKFDLEYFPKILGWPSISKIFRKSLNVFSWQRSWEGPWISFDLNYLKIHKNSISKSSRKPSSHLWPQKSSQDPWKIFDHEERREFLEWPLILKIFRWSLNEIWSRRCSESLFRRFYWYFFRFDISSHVNQLAFKVIWSFFSKSVFKKIEFDWHAIFQNYLSVGIQIVTWYAVIMLIGTRLLRNRAAETKKSISIIYRIRGCRSPKHTITQIESSMGPNIEDWMLSSSQ